MLLQFSSRAKGADLDQGAVPSCESGDFGDALLFKVEKPYHDLVLGLELGEKLLKKFTRGQGIIWSLRIIGLEDGVEHLNLILREVSPAQFGTASLRAQLVNAGGHGNPGHPMREGDVSLILFEAGEHLHKDLL